MRLLGKVGGKVAQWVRAGVKSLRQLKDVPMLWQIGFIILQGGGAKGFAALQVMIQGWLAGSQGAALAIASSRATAE